MTANDIRFIDVTDEDSSIYDYVHLDKLPKDLQYNATTLEPFFADIDIDKMKQFLTKFTSFRTRYYRSETGKQSQQFLLSTIKSIIAKSKHVSVTEFPHPWGQNSIIVRFEPRSSKGKWRMESAGDKAKDKPTIVVLGAHQECVLTSQLRITTGSQRSAAAQTCSHSSLHQAQMTTEAAPRRSCQPSTS